MYNLRSMSSTVSRLPWHWFSSVLLAISSTEATVSSPQKNWFCSNSPHNQKKKHDLSNIYPKCWNTSIEGTPYGKRIADDMHVCTNRAPLIEREAAACIKYLPLAVVLLCKARLLGGVGLLRSWLASTKRRAPLHTKRRASGPSARDPRPYTPDNSPQPCHLLRSDQPRGRKISRTCSLFPWLPIHSYSNSRTVRRSTSYLLEQ